MQLKNDAASSSVVVSQSTATIANKYKVKFTISKTAESVELSNLVTGTAYLCAYSGDGTPSGEEVAITVDNVARVRDTYTISVAWDEIKDYKGDTIVAGADPTSASDKQVLKNAAYTFTVRSGGNVQLLAKTDTVAATEETTRSVKVKFDASGELNTTVDLDGTGYYCVRTNNPNGLEYVSGEESAALVAAGQVPGKIWATPTSHDTSAAAGSYVKITTGESTHAEVWHLSEAEVTNTAPVGTRVDHGADTIYIAENSTGVSADGI